MINPFRPKPDPNLEAARAQTMQKMQDAGDLVPGRLRDQIADRVVSIHNIEWAEQLIRILGYDREALGAELTPEKKEEFARKIEKMQALTDAIIAQYKAQPESMSEKENNKGKPDLSDAMKDLKAEAGDARRALRTFIEDLLMGDLYKSGPY